MTPEQRRALDVYERLRRDLGKAPSSRDFRRVFPQRALADAFPAGRPFSTLQALAGDAPQAFSTKKSSLESVLLRWGELAMETLATHQRLPISADWRRAGHSPTISGIRKSHGKRWSEIPALFREQYGTDPAWGKVVAAIPAPPLIEEARVENEECFVYLMRDLRNGRHKIGSARDPVQRERTLQSEQPRTELVAKKKYVNRRIAGAIEKALHTVYSHKRARGEWFDLGEEDIAELRSTLAG